MLNWAIIVCSVLRDNNYIVSVFLSLVSVSDCQRIKSQRWNDGIALVAMSNRITEA